MSGEAIFERCSSSYERSVLQRLLFDRVHAAIFAAARGRRPASSLSGPPSICQWSQSRSIWR